MKSIPPIFMWRNFVWRWIWEKEKPWLKMVRGIFRWARAYAEDNLSTVDCLGYCRVSSFASKYATDIYQSRLAPTV
jgi:hypothetical protein